MKKIIEIDSPSGVNSKRMNELVLSFLKAGIRSDEIILQMNFVANEDVVKQVMHEFHVLKNRAAMSLDKRWTK